MRVAGERGIPRRARIYFGHNIISVKQGNRPEGQVAQAYLGPHNKYLFLLRTEDLFVDMSILPRLYTIPPIC